MKAEPRDTPTTSTNPEQKPEATPTAVIDIGTNAIRMAVAEIDDTGNVRVLDNLAQAVDLGRDTFTRGIIRKSTVEECARILRSYRQFLQEYQITREDRIRVVATSAVREAENSLAFVDRIFIATGLQVEPLDEAEVNRVTYLSVQPLLATEPKLTDARTMVCEVGGGSTELLVVQKGNVLFSKTYRLGSIRLRETLNAYRAPTVKLRHLMESQITLTIEEIIEHVSRDAPIEILALGGDARFAASELIPNWTPGQLARVPVEALSRLADQVLSMTTGKLVQRYHLTPSDAETLGPALLAMVELTKAFTTQHLWVANVNMRDGLLMQIAAKGQRAEHFDNQIIRSAMDLARKFDCDEAHARHVAELSRALFRALQNEHHLEPRHELFLYLAALLHESGMYISNASHHKHSMYLIANSEIFGLRKEDLRLMALVARYYRRAAPKPNHPGYATLDRKQRVAVTKMAALLRIADALDCSRSQRVGEIECLREHGRLVILVPGVDDLSLEQIAVSQKGTLFEDTFGMPVLLRTTGR